MFWLSKIIGAVVVLPSLLIVIAIVTVWASYKNWRRVVQVAAMLMVVFLYALSIVPVAEALLLPLEDWYPPLDQSKPYHADYIVVLGGGVVIHSPEYANATVLAPEPLKRMDYAIDLHQRLGIPLLFSGGGSPRGGSSEAEAYRQYCLKRGLPSTVLFIEPRSRNTDENAAETRRIYHPKRIILVTSAYHILRSVRIFSQHGMDSIPAPTDYKVQRANYAILDFFPDKSALYLSAVAIKEYIGLLFYITKSYV